MIYKSILLIIIIFFSACEKKSTEMISNTNAIVEFVMQKGGDKYYRYEIKLLKILKKDEKDRLNSLRKLYIPNYIEQPILNKKYKVDIKFNFFKEEQDIGVVMKFQEL